MIRIETRGAFVFATLDVPATRNALSNEMLDAIGDALTLAESQPAVRALLLRGAGGTFCAGGDHGRFKELAAIDAPDAGIDPIARVSRSFGAMLERLRASPVATIAIVEGAAIGGGAALAAACDFVLAESGAHFGMPDVRLGLPAAQAAPFIAARIGRAAALRLILPGRRISAAQALACGLADEVFDAHALGHRLNALLTELGHAEPAALRATKSILNRHGSEPLGTTLDHGARIFAAALRSGVVREGLDARGEQRDPSWVERPEPGLPDS